MPLENITTKLSRGLTGEAIKLFQAWSKQHGDQRLRNQLILLAGRWSRLQDAQIGNTLSSDSIRLETSQINHAILQLLEDAKQSPAVRKELANPPPEPAVPTPLPMTVSQPAPKAKNPTAAPPPSRKTAILVGGVLAAALLVLIVLIPCPSSAQYELFHVLLALAAGGLAAALTGYLVAKPTATIRATGGLAFSALVFFTQPEQGFAEGKCEEATPFTFTLALDPAAPGRDYPTFKPEEHLPQLWVGNNWQDGTVDGNLVADWKNLAPALDSKRLAFRFKPNPDAVWEAAADSVSVSRDAGRQLAVQPNGTLGRLRGRILGADQAPLVGVTVAFEELTDTTNASGRFQLDIPVARQRIRYQLEVRATGYPVYTGEHYPNSAFDVRLTPK